MIEAELVAAAAVGALLGALALWLILRASKDASRFTITAYLDVLRRGERVNGRGPERVEPAGDRVSPAGSESSSATFSRRPDGGSRTED